MFDDSVSWPLAPGVWDFDPCEAKTRTEPPSPVHRHSQWQPLRSDTCSSASSSSSCSSSLSTESEFDELLLRAPRLPNRPLLSSSPVPCESYEPDAIASVEGTRPPYTSRYCALGLQLSAHLPTPPVSPMAKRRRLEETQETVSTEERGRTLQRSRRAHNSPSPRRPSTSSEQQTREPRPIVHRASSVPTEPTTEDLEQLAPWAQRIGRGRGRSHDLPKHGLRTQGPSAFSFTNLGSR